MKLRPYQEECVAAVRSELEKADRTAVILPTGAGKTVIFSHLTQAMGAERTLIVAHRRELIKQAARQYHNATGRTPGIVLAQRKEIDTPVVVGSIQTLSQPGVLSRLAARGRWFTVVDECHHATADSYSRLLELAAGKSVGFTATMMRSDGADLGKVWNSIAYQKSLLWMIRHGYLVNPRGIRVQVPDLNLQGVKGRSDYNEDDLGARLEDSLAPSVIAEAYREHAADKPGVIFAPTVATAQLFAEAMREAGFTCEAIWGDMPQERRAQLIRDFDEGRIQVLSNCMVLTEGFDSPRAEVCVIARLTKSSGLYRQMLGRVLRLFPGKTSALVIDVCGVSRLHDVATMDDLLAEEAPGRKLKEGQSLLDAYVEWEEEEDSPSDKDLGYSGPVESVEIDLFAASRQQWLQTNDGHWFLPVGDRFVLLCPRQDGKWDVVSVHKSERKSTWLAREIDDMGYAMAHGESSITDDEELYAAKDRAWRKRKATERALMYAAQLGCDVSAGMRGGAVADMISVALASRRLDPVVRARMKAA